MSNVHSIEIRLASNAAYRWNEAHHSAIERAKTKAEKAHLLDAACRAGIDWGRKRYRFRAVKRTEKAHIIEATSKAYLHQRDLFEACFRTWIAGTLFVRELGRKNP